MRTLTKPVSADEVAESLSRADGEGIGSLGEKDRTQAHARTYCEAPARGRTACPRAKPWPRPASSSPSLTRPAQIQDRWEVLLHRRGVDSGDARHPRRNGPNILGGGHGPLESLSGLAAGRQIEAE